MSSLGGPNIVTSGLVLHLDAGNPKSYPGTGTIWYDRAANLNAGVANNGTLINGPVFNSGNGGSVVFDGVDDYVSISQNINPPNITLEFVYKTLVNSPHEYLISNSRDCCGTYNGYELYTFNGRPRFQIWNSTNVGLSGTETLTNQIYHVTATYNGSQLKIYQNGILTGTANSTLGIGNPPSFNLVIGAMGYGPAIYNLTGNIYTSKIYNRALSSQEVLQNYNATKSRYGL
jgi:hypothetical protein